jgi:hypothetical protein
MALKPQLIIENFEGKHNSNLIESRDRLINGGTYQDLSTICIVPALSKGGIHPKIVQNWWSLITPMNQKFIRFFVIDMEVGQAYSTAIEQILSNPDLSQWKYILTLETDNMPPPDGLMKLYEDMKEYDAVGGLYWTKGEGGQPMIYGNPNIMPLNFVPQLPQINTLQRCNGLGMGFTLFKLDIFKDPRLTKPYFKTMQEYREGSGVKLMTQDLYFFENLAKLGYKVACDTRVKVGHYDQGNDLVW